MYLLAKQNLHELLAQTWLPVSQGCIKNIEALLKKATKKWVYLKQVLMHCSGLAKNK